VCLYSTTVSSDEFVRIYLKLEFSNFKSNFAKFDICDQIRLMLTSNLTLNLVIFDEILRSKNGILKLNLTKARLNLTRLDQIRQH
jgi:hypothetical protein